MVLQSQVKKRGNRRAAFPRAKRREKRARKFYFGLRSTRMTESPRKNILGTKRSRATRARRCPFVPPPEAPPPAFGASVHISLTFSRTMLQWRSKAWEEGWKSEVWLIFFFPGEEEEVEVDVRDDDDDEKRTFLRSAISSPFLFRRSLSVLFIPLTLTRARSLWLFLRLIKTC